MQILNLDSEPKDPPSKKVSSTVHAPTSSLPSKEVPQHLLGNEDLAWERFTMAVTDTDVSACYNMSLKDFEHSGVHDLFKVSIYIYIYIYIFFFYICIHLVFNQQRRRHILNKTLISVGNVQVYCYVQAGN